MTGITRLVNFRVDSDGTIHDSEEAAERHHLRNVIKSMIGNSFANGEGAIDHCANNILEYLELQGIKITGNPEPDPNDFENHIINLLCTTKSKIPAIKAYRLKTGKGLKESKDAVEKIGYSAGVLKKCQTPDFLAYDTYEFVDM